MGVNSPPRSPCLQVVQQPLSGSTSTYSKCRLCLDAVCISCNHYYPYRVGAVLLPDGHGVGPLALGHGLLCPLLVGPPSSEMVGCSRRPSR